jgi:hypothetical protein
MPVRYFVEKEHISLIKNEKSRKPKTVRQSGEKYELICLIQKVRNNLRERKVITE